MSRGLFLRWLLLQAVFVLFLAGMGAVYGGRLGGSSLVAVPIILLVFAGASAYGGYLSWLVEAQQEWVGTDRGGAVLQPRRRALSNLEWLAYSSWLCQMIGIMATVFGAWELLGGASDSAALADRIQGGLGVALMATFVGCACSVVLELEKRLIESS